MPERDDNGFAAMKTTTDRPFADPEKAAHRLMQHAHAFETVHDGRIYIEKINGPFLYVDRGTPAEYSAGLAPLSLVQAEASALSAPRVSVH
jgi:hypothetical protein